MKFVKLSGLLLGLGLLVSVPIVQVRSNSYHNDYPSIWKNSPKDALMDSWNMKSRECTSYVAWKAYETFKYKAYDWGDAYKWPFNAKGIGLTVDESATIHSAAVNTSFKPGHVMWVEKINKDGTIHVSQYNADNKGNYSEANISTSGLKFIHFN